MKFFAQPPVQGVRSPHTPVSPLGTGHLPRHRGADRDAGRLAARAARATATPCVRTLGLLGGRPGQSACEVDSVPTEPGLGRSLSLGPCPTPSCRGSSVSTEGGRGSGRCGQEADASPFLGRGPSFALIGFSRVGAHRRLTTSAQRSGTRAERDIPGFAGHAAQERGRLTALVGGRGDAAVAVLMTRLGQILEAEPGFPGDPPSGGASRPLVSLLGCRPASMAVAWSCRGARLAGRWPCHSVVPSSPMSRNPVPEGEPRDHMGRRGGRDSVGEAGDGVRVHAA